MAHGCRMFPLRTGRGRCTILVRYAVHAGVRDRYVHGASEGRGLVVRRPPSLPSRAVLLPLRAAVLHRWGRVLRLPRSPALRVGVWPPPRKALSDAKQFGLGGGGGATRGWKCRTGLALGYGTAFGVASGLEAWGKGGCPPPLSSIPLGRANGRPRLHRGRPGQPVPSLPDARAAPGQPASGGGCLPQPRWAVCTTRDGAHQGQTSREGEGDDKGAPHRHQQPTHGRPCPPPPPRVPPPPPSVPLPHLFTRQGTTPPSTSRVGPTQVSGQGTPHDGRGPWSGGAHNTRRNDEGARNAHVHHGQRWSNWAPRTHRNVVTTRGGMEQLGLTHTETRQGMWRTTGMWRGVDSKTVERPPQQPAQPPTTGLR